jgi:hypothetical protein
MQFVNDQFYELTGHTHAPSDQFEWFDLIADEDVGEVESDWAGMLPAEKDVGRPRRCSGPYLGSE